MKNKNNSVVVKEGPVMKLVKRPMGTIVGKVYYTEDLSQFKTIETNRDLQARVKNIADSMKKDGVYFKPIIVDIAGNVIDGEHRLAAARKLGIGIYFIIDESCQEVDQSASKMVKMSLNEKSWVKTDFLKSWVKAGKISYIILFNLMKEFPVFSVTDCLMLLNNNASYPSSTDKSFENGMWKHKSLETAREWGNFLMKLKDVFPDGYRRTHFMRSMITVLSKYPEFEMERFLTKCKQAPHKLQIYGDRRNNYFMIDDIYNYKMQDRLDIRL